MWASLVVEVSGASAYTSALRRSVRHINRYPQGRTITMDTTTWASKYDRAAMDFLTA